MKYLKLFEAHQNELLFDIDKLLDKIVRSKIYNNEEKLFLNINKILDNFLTLRGYILLGEGRNRKVYISKDKKRVIKLAKNWDGTTDNHHEYRVQKNEKFFAKCKLFIFKISGIEFLIMEYLEPINTFKLKNKPFWIDFIDCGQVGIDNKGELKAYDFGLL